MKTKKVRPVLVKIEKEPISYTEEECYSKLHNLMTDIHLNNIVINDDRDLRLWFNQNKNK